MAVGATACSEHSVLRQAFVLKRLAAFLDPMSLSSLRGVSTSLRNDLDSNDIAWQAACTSHLAVNIAHVFRRHSGNVSLRADDDGGLRADAADIVLPSLEPEAAPLCVSVVSEKHESSFLRHCITGMDGAGANAVGSTEALTSLRIGDRCWLAFSDWRSCWFWHKQALGGIMRGGFMAEAMQAVATYCFELRRAGLTAIELSLRIPGCPLSTINKVAEAVGALPHGLAALGLLVDGQCGFASMPPGHQLPHRARISSAFGYMSCYSHIRAMSWLPLSRAARLQSIIAADERRTDARGEHQIDYGLKSTPVFDGDVPVAWLCNTSPACRRSPGKTTREIGIKPATEPQQAGTAISSSQSQGSMVSYAVSRVSSASPAVAGVHEDTTDEVDTGIQVSARTTAFRAFCSAGQACLDATHLVLGWSAEGSGDEVVTVNTRTGHVFSGLIGQPQTLLRVASLDDVMTGMPDLDATLKETQGEKGDDDGCESGRVDAAASDSNGTSWESLSRSSSTSQTAEEAFLARIRGQSVAQAGGIEPTTANNRSGRSEAVGSPGRRTLAVGMSPPHARKAEPFVFRPAWCLGHGSFRVVSSRIASTGVRSLCDTPTELSREAVRSGSGGSSDHGRGKSPHCGGVGLGDAAATRVATARDYAAAAATSSSLGAPCASPLAGELGDERSGTRWSDCTDPVVTAAPLMATSLRLASSDSVPPVAWPAQRCHIIGWIASLSHKLAKGWLRADGVDNMDEGDAPETIPMAGPHGEDVLGDEELARLRSDQLDLARLVKVGAVHTKPDQDADVTVWARFLAAANQQEQCLSLFPVKGPNSSISTALGYHAAVGAAILPAQCVFSASKLTLFWAYRVTIWADDDAVAQGGPASSQLYQREWICTDGWNSQPQIVRGSGVIGHHPCIVPGEQGMGAFNYASGTRTEHVHGALLEGTMTFVRGSIEEPDADDPGGMMFLLPVARVCLTPQSFLH